MENNIGGNTMALTNDESVLNDIYEGAKVGSQAINDLLTKVDDEAFRNDLQVQDKEYQKIRSEAASQLLSRGAEPDDIGTMKKFSVKMSVDMNAMFSSSTSHLAEMMITGSNMGITNMTKVLNSYAKPDPEVKALGEKLISTEEENIQRLKRYLK
jgi:uncharacterized protein (DUF305 family)